MERDRFDFPAAAQGEKMGRLEGAAFKMFVEWPALGWGLIPLLDRIDRAMSKDEGSGTAVSVQEADLNDEPVLWLEPGEGSAGSDQ